MSTNKKKSLKKILTTFTSKLKKRNLAVFLSLIILAGALFYFKNQFIVAIVNGRPITRLALIKELEKQGGRSVLESLVTKTLILQEAKKQNVTVNKDEINQEIKEIEENLIRQGQDFDELLKSQGMTRKDLEEQIKIQKIVEQIAGKDIQVSDEEIDDFIKENKESLPKDSSSEEVRLSVKEQLRQQKMSEAVQSWIESLHNNAKINYLR